MARTRSRYERLKGPSGREARKLEREAIARGEVLDEDDLRLTLMSDPLWGEHARLGSVATRTSLLEDLVALSRYHARPFLLGEFYARADVAPLSTMLASAGWLGDPGARPDRADTRDGYAPETIHLAGKVGENKAYQGDQFTNHTTPNGVSVFEDYLELFFDWLLPLARVNARLRAQAEVVLRVPGISSRVTRTLNDASKGLAGAAINAVIAPYLQTRDNTIALVSGRVTLEPSQDVLDEYWRLLDKRIDTDECTRSLRATPLPTADADLIRQHIANRRGTVPAKETASEPAVPHVIRTERQTIAVAPDQLPEIENRGHRWVDPAAPPTAKEVMHTQSLHEALGGLDGRPERPIESQEYLAALERLCPEGDDPAVRLAVVALADYRGRRLNGVTYDSYDAYVRALVAESPAPRPDPVDVIEMSRAVMTEALEYRLADRDAEEG